MSSKRPVTVIGLGPMGQAMVRTFLDAGHPVTVWNRTASRADALVERGAVRAASAAEALSANELVVLSLTDYNAMYEVLEPAAHALSGRVVVNLSSDTPEKTRAGARWIAEHGGIQLSGGVTVPPSGIGQPESSTFYSGPRDSFEKHRATLETLTRAEFRGEDPGLAALYYQLGMVMFWTSMLSYWQAIALGEVNGLTAADVLPHAAETMASMPNFLSFYAERIDAGEHGGDVDRLAMGMASVEHVLHTNVEAGVDTALPAAVVDLFRRGMDAGYEADSFSSLVKLMRRPAA
ncbi:3-hydroxyisobutyrate dehydrogenase [Saccharopolyspora antimicrobica]|uniref:3-hydroxyisobutyrate dehydrogenase n=1 Tax=Saccharopolyspora antimicrobica TaxID=455193 RepID=A0A1I4XQD1_9PSEU|nr:NAD(P)-binding domain-containing protein [Saccharopolyspora antimicrobica]RKT84591.1 3-hydroxyisobutyrate dehydrogenase-like beta-hydroxyacid dehydrogenase [Saccharopolyspora antimicrobica]SFN27643.1 3-hydroxyisobutyrate dehydrogenase [Saccharopolyspora antimicrobica]